MYRLSSFFLGLSSISFLIFIFLFTNQLLPQSLAFSTTPTLSSSKQEKTEPTIIRIPSISLYLPIVTSHIVNGQWEVTTKGVSYLSGSALPGENGNSIFYGHNWNSLLGNLHNTHIGDSLFIEKSDNTEEEFVITQIKVVEPTDISVLDNTGDPTITIYTCTGFLDSKRLILIAKKKN